MVLPAAVLVLHACVAYVALSPEAIEPSSGAFDGTVEPSPSYPAATLEDVRVADAKAAMVEKKVKQLEASRDEAWKVARGNLAVATHPPIRSSAVFAMLNAETEAFRQLEANINQAKREQAHYRRVAELAGGARDAAESAKLRGIRVAGARKALADAIAAEEREKTREVELLRELQVEKARSSF